VTDLALRLFEALYSIPGLAQLVAFVGRALAALIPSGVDVAAVALGLARVAWYAAQTFAVAAVIAAVTLAAYGVVRVAAFAIDRAAARKAPAR
jgi:hypothetical protein